jgi:hypothetical protein
LSCLVLSCFGVSLSCLALSCLVLSCFGVSLSCLALSCLVLFMQYFVCSFSIPYDIIPYDSMYGSSVPDMASLRSFVSTLFLRNQPSSLLTLSLAGNDLGPLFARYILVILQLDDVTSGTSDHWVLDFGRKRVQFGTHNSTKADHYFDGQLDQYQQPYYGPLEINLQDTNIPDHLLLRIQRQLFRKKTLGTANMEDIRSRDMSTNLPVQEPETRQRSLHSTSLSTTCASGELQLERLGHSFERQNLKRGISASTIPGSSELDTKPADVEDCVNLLRKIRLEHGGKYTLNST